MAGAHRQRLISWRSEEKMEGSRPDSSACSSARACEMSVACGSMVCRRREGLVSAVGSAAGGAARGERSRTRGVFGECGHDATHAAQTEAQDGQGAGLREDLLGLREQQRLARCHLRKTRNLRLHARHLEVVEQDLPRRAYPSAPEAGPPPRTARSCGGPAGKRTGRARARAVRASSTPRSRAGDGWRHR
jgi:hypothetical protein